MQSSQSPRRTTQRGVFGFTALLSAILLCSLVGSAAANTWYVDASAAGSGTGSLVDPFLVLQDGIDAASDGETVSVASGTYTGSINGSGAGLSAIFINKDILVLGAGAGSTTIDGGGTVRAVEFGGATTLATILQGFTITGGLSINQGAGVRIHGDATIRDCTITGNAATTGNGNGGGISFSNSSVVLENCVVSNNSAVTWGGGISLGGGSASLEMTDCVLSGNSSGATGGTGIYSTSGTITMTNCEVTGATVGRAALFFRDSMVDLTDCKIFDNSVGGVVAQGTDITMTGCVVSGNSSCCAESGLNIRGGSTGTLTNCTITGTISTNPAYNGAGLFVDNSVVTVTNSILWDNLFTATSVNGTATLTVTYSDVQGGYPGTGNIDVDPVFINAAGGDFTLACTSPAINAGDPSAAFNDPDGSRNDMGAFHTQLPNLSTWYVDASVPGPGCGTAADPFLVLQDGIDAASAGETVSVASGTYTGSINGSGAGLSAIFINKDILVLGAGAGSTTIDGGGTVRAVEFGGATTLTTTLQGFTITGGLSINQGAGVRIHGDATIRDCTITGNAATTGNGNGGGISFSNSSVVLENCVVSNNSAVTWGGGISLGGGSASLEMTDCVLSGNSSGATGGTGIYSTSGTITMTNCEVTGATVGRAALFFRDSMVDLTDCKIFDNSVGGVVAQGSNITMTGCVVSGNSSCCAESGVNIRGGSTGTITNCTITGTISTNPAYNGAGLFVDNSVVTVTNSILWDNLFTATSVNGTATLTVTYSDVQGGYPGTGNIDVDPVFINAAGGDFTLACTSPAINAGDPSAAFNDPDGSRNDMGAFPTSGCILNQSPDCALAAIADQEANASCEAVISNSDVTGVTDPDDDELTITISPTTLVLGANTVTVSADDGNGGLCSTDITVNVTSPTSTISGTVSGGGDLVGVTVKLLEAAQPTNIVDEDVTIAGGLYSFDLAPGGAAYLVMVVEPLGYSAEANVSVDLSLDCSGNPVSVDFDLTPFVVVNNARSKGYWKHQFDVYVKGRGHAHETETQLEGYIAEILLRYILNFSDMFVDMADGTDDFEEWQETLSVKGNAGTEAKATAQLAALALNVMSLKIGQYEIVTDDGRTAGDVLTYVSQLLTDGDPSNDELAKDLAESVNNQETIAAAIVPEGGIQYRGPGPDLEVVPSVTMLHGAAPNPSELTTMVSYDLAGEKSVRLTVYNALGQEVVVLVDEFQTGGTHRVPWNGTDNQGHLLANGLYLLRLEAGKVRESKSMILLK